MTGIHNKDVADAPLIEDMLPSFTDFIGNDIVIAHNANFDVNFIYEAAQNSEMPPFSNDFLDTLRLSRYLYPNLLDHRLATLKDYLDVNETDISYD